MARTEPVTRISSAEPPLPVIDAEAGLASAFQDSMRSYTSREQELAQPEQAQKIEPEPRPVPPRLPAANDDGPGLITRLAQIAKAIWNYLFG